MSFSILPAAAVVHLSVKSPSISRFYPYRDICRVGLEFLNTSPLIAGNRCRLEASPAAPCRVVANFRVAQP